MQKRIGKLIAGFLLMVVFHLKADAQNGRLTGKVSDDKNAPVAAATLTELITHQIFISNADGTFSLPLPAGNQYVLEIKAIGFITKTITDIEIKENEVTDLPVFLASSENQLEEVAVTTSSRKESVNSMLRFQKNTPVVAQVVSAESIRKSPDKNTGEVLKRVTGLSLQEGKYIVARGLSDRYNQAMLNGVLLSSTEADRKTFSFDLFPASVIENIVVNKTFMPENPAEWAGGLIQITTTDIPSKGFLDVQIGTNFNTTTIGKEFNHAKGGSLDFLGFDDGSRALPAGFPTKSAFAALPVDQKIANGIQVASKDWGYETNNSALATLGQSLRLNGGFNTRVFNKETGGVFSINYNRSLRNLEYQNRFFNINQTKAEPSFDYLNNKYDEETMLGGMANFSMRLSKNNKISFRNLLNVHTNNYTVLRTGKDFEADAVSGENIKAYEYGFKQTTFSNNELQVEQSFLQLKAKLNAFGSFTIVDQYVPDQRRLQYNQQGHDLQSPWAALISNTLSQKTGSIFYSNLNDYIYSAGADLQKEFKLAGIKQSVKGGYLLQVKDRLYNARPFSVYLPSDDPGLKMENPSEIFDAANFGTAADQFHFDELSGIYFRYMAHSILNAAYVQFQNEMGKNIRLTWGARYENFDQLTGSKKPSDPRYNHRRSSDILPSVNATYRINSLSNLRVAASQTLIRPEFRELTSTAFYDFELGATVIGNPGLVTTKVSNIDLRYELYQKPGELLTAGLFYKYFKNPIELVFNQTGAGSSNTFNYIDNVQTAAKTYGAEIEFRKKLDAVSSTVKNFTIQGNFTYIYNRVQFKEQSLDRPMQGQSPYLLNLGLLYEDQEGSWSGSLLYNQYGRRILYVGNEQIPAIWEAPRPLLDLQLAKAVLNGKGKVTLNVTDLLNRPALFYHDLNADKKYSADDALALKRKFGTGVSVSFSYKIR